MICKYIVVCSSEATRRGVGEAWAVCTARCGVTCPRLGSIVGILESNPSFFHVFPWYYLLVVATCRMECGQEGGKLSLRPKAHQLEGSRGYVESA